MALNNNDSKTKNETEKQPLDSGIPCRVYSCSKCCVGTCMPLTGLDIKRIRKQGYRYKDFVIRRKKDRLLKNLRGKCFFLGDHGCKIYFFRPNGCRFYPLVYNESTNQAVIHDLCPYGNKFKVYQEDVKNLTCLINSLRK